MKTILYNPIFINPQAYYVFPQLYDIEKGDSFIEPAIYSGYLLIEDLISNTSSQVTDTREVDFTQFAGKRIRISQYTNLGAVVLGEWLLPEGEPSGPSFHQSLVDAWFMSGLSNSDKPTQIVGVKKNKLQLKNFAYALNSGFGEYAVDFTLWKGTGTTSDSVSIIKEAGIQGLAVIYYNQMTSDIPSFSIKITGLNSGEILFYYRNSEGLEKHNTYTKDGVYTLPNCYKEGTGGVSSGFTIKTTDKITITQLPTAYEGALVFDGVDDWCEAVPLPLLTDYTVICRRVIEQKQGEWTVASKAASFIFEEWVNNDRTRSFGAITSLANDINYSDSVSWQTKDFYNGNKIYVGDLKDLVSLKLGVYATRYFKGAIYYFALYDKSLTPEEIEEEKVKLENYWEGGKNELA